MTEQNEPSMEDILSSIRKILSDENIDGKAPEPEPVPEPPEPEPEPEPALAPAEPEEDVFDLSEAMVVDEPKEAEPEPEPAQPAHELISEPVRQYAACKLAELAKAMAEDKVAYLGNAGITLEGLVKELLKPFLKEWLDANLENVVEKLVSKEIQRLGDKIKLF